MDGVQAFIDIEHRGMRIDEEYLDRTITWAENKITDLETKIRDDVVYKEWRKVYGGKSDLGSTKQLGHIIFNVLGHECTKRTKSGLPSTSAEAFENLDVPFVKKWTMLESLKKTVSTFLKGIRSETINGYLHPFFNLHRAITFRSSSSDPNFQNFPNRDKRLSKMVRQAFIPRSEEYVLMEVDYGALEFRGAACFWKDPSMVEYASDPTKDIHRDMAMDCFMLEMDQVAKDVRGWAKNQFVFPTLYGSFYKACANGLWNAIEKGNLKTVDGICLFEHLESHGVGNLNGFIDHMKGVEDKFNRRFPTWSTQKEVWWDQYLKRGWFEMETGFVCQGIFTRNDLMNYPIQGPSFHLTLWSLIQLERIFKERGYKTVIIGQIHDSICMDVHKDEIEDVVQLCDEVMTVEVRKHWPWVIVPLEVEFEIAEKNWYEKKEYIQAA